MWFTVIVTFALSVWVVMWSVGTKGFDAFRVALLIIFIGIAVKMIGRHLPGASDPRA